MLLTSGVSAFAYQNIQVADSSLVYSNNVVETIQFEGKEYIVKYYINSEGERTAEIIGDGETYTTSFNAQTNILSKNGSEVYIKNTNDIGLDNDFSLFTTWIKLTTDSYVIPLDDTSTGLAIAAHFAVILGGNIALYLEFSSQLLGLIGDCSAYKHTYWDEDYTHPSMKFETNVYRGGNFETYIGSAVWYGSR